MNTSELGWRKQVREPKARKDKVEDCSQGKILMRSSTASGAVDYLLRK